MDRTPTTHSPTPQLHLRAVPQLHAPQGPTWDSRAAAALTYTQAPPTALLRAGPAESQRWEESPPSDSSSIPAPTHLSPLPTSWLQHSVHTHTPPCNALPAPLVALHRSPMQCSLQPGAPPAPHSTPSPPTHLTWSLWKAHVYEISPVLCKPCSNCKPY